jgi:hypothetical protein
MKKIISLFILIFIISTVSSQAQDKDKKQKIGIRGGWQLSSMVVDGNKPDTAQYLNSFYIGLFRDNKLASILYFGTGIEYFQNGLKYSNNTKRVVHTISIPLGLKLKLGPVFILGGAAANVKVSEKIIIGDDKYDPVEGNRTEWFDVAAFAGAGVKIFFLSVEARYHWGLLDVRNDLKNRYFQLGLGVSF